jgi:hypothetical protein
MVTYENFTPDIHLTPFFFVITNYSLPYIFMHQGFINTLKIFQPI